MSSRREAENVVKKIRKSRRANDPGGPAADANARSLSRALDMLSTQLYTQTTHFILELIQNADDNTYAADVDPLLTLVYREDGFLWIGCNEVGFTKANVEAICDINDSTKKVKDATKGYIGEKGIGFKSVFKVADVVWVSSGHYTFRFERDKVLGMIVPIWCDFNSTTLVSERTMFCLRIPNVVDRNTVKADLLKLETELLLFLRKLRRIDVRIYDNGQVKPSCWFAHTRTQPSVPQPHTIVTLARKDLIAAEVEHSEDLFISKKIIQGMPLEAKREGISATEVVLAFPIVPYGQKIRPRAAYNFLPICSFGFTFLLQADFILTANRENIVRDNAWNNALLDGLLMLFVSAVQQFNQTGICKFSWPTFTARSDAAQGTIMAGFMSRLRKSIQSENVLESQAGYLSRPSELMLVPAQFTDGLDPPQPLFDDPLNTFRYASFEYSPPDLAAMGLIYQTPQQICALLRWMSPEQLEAKSSTWHSKLAAGIADSNPSAFETARLIPLRNGEWISSLDGSFYFPNGHSAVDIPDGVDVKIISKAACDDAARRHTFDVLGAKLLTTSHVCDLILDRHRFVSISNNNLSVSCLVSHAWYLFSHGSLSLDYGMVKLANELGQAVSGDDLYMQLTDSSFRMRDYLPSSHFSADFVHSSYLTQGDPSKRTHWYKWLTDTLHVSSLPNILSVRNGSVTREFQHLVDSHPSRVWLTLIKDNWQHYALDPASGSKRIGAILVQCTNQQRCPLRDAYLATTNISQEPLAYQYINLVDVHDPTNLSWLNLSRLGLRTTPDLDFYLALLRCVAGMPPSEADRNAVIRLYQGIEKHLREDLDRVRAAFADERLILPQSYTYPSSWRTSSECRWNGPVCLTSMERLSMAFPTCKKLFVETLNIPDAGPTDVLDEICSMNKHVPGASRDRRERIKTLLLTLSTYTLTALDLGEPLKRLFPMELVPVRKSDQVKFSAFDDAKWFTPDRQRYTSRFEGKVWMLDCEKTELASLSSLFERMGVTSREISRHVTEATITERPCAVHPQITKDLRAKAGYIALLVRDVPDQERVSALVKSIEVLSSASLVLRSFVTVSGNKIYGDDEKGRTVLQRMDSGCPRLFFSAESIANGSLPWYLACESLLDFLEIPEARHALLNSILHIQDCSLIEDILERAGLLEGGHSLAPADCATQLNGDGYVKATGDKALHGMDHLSTPQRVIATERS